jgi:hypothetical protein
VNATWIGKSPTGIEDATAPVATVITDTVLRLLFVTKTFFPLGLAATATAKEPSARGMVWIHAGAALAGVITGVAMNKAIAAKETAARLIVVFMIFQSVQS